MKTPSPVGQFAIRHRLAIAFISVALCLGGVYAAFHLPSSVFPQTNFPRVVILVDNGVMPADEMMATVTRPIEEVMKDIPGAVRVRSTTGRGSAEISVFFTWNVDMVQSELHVEARLSQIRASLPATVSTSTRRLTFSAFPILGVSLTSPRRDNIELWEMARYEIKPRFLRIPGVARVDLVGGRTPEYQVIVDPLKLAGRQPEPEPSHRRACRRTTKSPRRACTRRTTRFTWRWWTGACITSTKSRSLIVTFASGRVGPHPGFCPGRARSRAGLQCGHGGRSRRGAAQRAQPARRQHHRHRQRPEKGHRAS